MSSPTKASQRHQTTKSGRKTGGEPLSLAETWDYELHEPKIKGERYGLVEVCSPTVRVRLAGKEKRRYVYVRCVKCKGEKWVMFDNIRRGIAKGCRSCLQPKRFPKWLYSRMEAMRSRCTNPKTDAYHRYGGRGIQFRFPSVADACLWVMANFSLDEVRVKEFDRKDNDGHYEPGNIRLSTRKQNMNHTRKPKWTAMVHRFRQLHPYVTYADATLVDLFAKGFTPDQIVIRWKTPMARKKLGFGISSTPDPFIASLCKDF